MSALLLFRKLACCHLSSRLGWHREWWSVSPGGACLIFIAGDFSGAACVVGRWPSFALAVALVRRRRRVVDYENVRLVVVKTLKVVNKVMNSIFCDSCYEKCLHSCGQKVKRKQRTLPYWTVSCRLHFVPVCTILPVPMVFFSLFT